MSSDPSAKSSAPSGTFAPAPASASNSAAPSSASASAASSSSSSSYFSAFKGFAASAAKVVVDTASKAKDQIKSTVNDLQAYPSQVMCKQCKQMLIVPNGAFNWTCPNKHAPIDRSVTQCAECKAPRPQNLPLPKMRCAACNVETEVPTSNASRYMSESGENIKSISKQAYEQTKSSIEFLQATPSTFHCAHCDALLAVPTGNWACQTCTLQNVEDAKQCARCSQKKSEQKAICGVCAQSTLIPTSNFGDSIFHGVRAINKSSKRVIYDLTGTPYVSCPRCNTQMKVVIKGANTPKEGQNSKAAPAEGKAVAASSAAVPSSAPEGVDSNPNNELICEKCRHKFSADD